MSSILDHDPKILLELATLFKQWKKENLSIPFLTYWFDNTPYNTSSPEFETFMFFIVSNEINKEN